MDLKGKSNNNPLVLDSEEDSGVKTWGSGVENELQDNPTDEEESDEENESEEEENDDKSHEKTNSKNNDDLF